MFRVFRVFLTPEIKAIWSRSIIDIEMQLIRGSISNEHNSYNGVRAYVISLYQNKIIRVMVS